MAYRAVLALLWLYGVTRVGRGEELPRGIVLSWVRGRVLDGLGLDEPPPARRGDGVGVRPGARRPRLPRASRSAAGDPGTGTDEDSSQMILFPSSDSSCVRPDSFTYRFHPSVTIRDAALTSARFWFYAGPNANSSSSLFIAAAAAGRRRAAGSPSASDPDGWTAYDLDGGVLALVARGPFLLQVVCDSCRCLADGDETPFLHLRVGRSRPVARFPRSAAAAVPWSPSAVHLLQRPSQEAPGRRFCRRAAVDISFEELGWDSWVVQPKALTFHYCHGNCSAPDGAALPLDGVTQCCAPVPGTMRSLAITTTSDGGYTFKRETLPNLMPQECACI